MVQEVKMGPEASLTIVFITLGLGCCATAGGIYAEFVRTGTPTAEQVGTLGHVTQCAYQSSRAHLVAWICSWVLVAMQLLVTIISGCVCCCTLTYARGWAHNWSMILGLFTWITFFAGELCFLSGAYINKYHTSQTIFEYDYDVRRCFKTRAHVYFYAAGFALLNTAFCILFYGLAQKSKFEAWVEQGAPTPRLYSVKTMKSFVIAGPAKKGPLRETMEDPLLE
eukprot:TRINITY_DN11262_c0_g1_i1.p1 TRINITY_DN11262_c0_g1~~TRINITY_DN11262_c0_g1_i1.p1  ORF type:complete len:224 (+),score=27.59 TRINITY_DN11262_c0_g1_i1:323-994(+)